MVKEGSHLFVGSWNKGFDFVTKPLECSYFTREGVMPLKREEMWPLVGQQHPQELLSDTDWPGWEGRIRLKVVWVVRWGRKERVWGELGVCVKSQNTLYEILRYSYF